MVLAFTRPPNQVLLVFEKQLIARRWRPPPPPPTEERTGFISAASYAAEWGNAYCSDSGAAMVSYVPAPMGGTYLKVQHLRNNEFSICAPRRAERGFPELSFKFPALLSATGMAQH